MDLEASDLDDRRRRWLEAVLPQGRTTVDDAARVDLIRAMEELKSTLCALQGDLAVDLDASQRAQQAERGERAERRGGGVAAQIGLARRESPHRAQVLLGMAKDLRAELPHTRAALREGRLSEHRARIVVTETSGLDPADRARVDAELCADPDALEGVGTRRIESLARAAAQRLDPASAVRRARRAEGDRHVTIRPAPDTMTYLTALLPVAQGVAVYAALRAAADSAVATGAAGERGRGQLMADTLVERLTGRGRADDVDVQVAVVVSDRTLLGGGTEPATVPGHGPVPAEIARHLVAHAVDPDTDATAWVRRLYADPAGDLVALASARRVVNESLAAFLRLRDQGLCRTPWCDAPVRHADHVEPAETGGATSATNTQGLCEACNHAKQAVGWRQGAGPPLRVGRHRVVTITPTGHTYVSTAPAPPRPAHPPTSRSPMEQRFARLIAQAC
ncbi:HNH endonuclease [Nocardioides marinquilinus]